MNQAHLLHTDALLVDNLGRLLQKIKLTQPRQPINISTLKPGTYYLRLANGEALKLIKRL